MDEPITRKELMEEMDKIYVRLNKHSEQIVVLETLVDNMKDLPDTIASLDKTMALMNQNLENLNTKVDSVVTKAKELNIHNDEQDKEITAINDKSKVDILDFLKENWWKICVSAAAVLALLKSYIIK